MPLKFYSLVPGFEPAWYKRCCFKANSSFSVQILLLSKCGFKIHSFQLSKFLSFSSPPSHFTPPYLISPVFFSQVQTLTCTLGWQWHPPTALKHYVIKLLWDQQQQISWSWWKTKMSIITNIMQGTFQRLKHFWTLMSSNYLHVNQKNFINKSRKLWKIRTASF